MPFGVAFGVAARDAGLSVWQASGFSVLVFTGSAQFAAVTILGSGGSAVAAVVGGLLLNVRSLAFGVVMAPALSGGPWWKRALLSQFMIDETTAVGSAQAERRWQRYGYVVSGATLFVAWNAATLLGAAGLSSAGDVITDWGLDAAIPAAFLALLWPRLRPTAREAGARAARRASAKSGEQRTDDRQHRVALVGALIAVALTPVAPPGVPIVAAAGAVVVALR
jgi:predicted branched-subunit amino acid permease